MAGGAGTLETLARHLGLALQPLEQALAPDRVLQSIADLGLELPASVLANASFASAVNGARTAAAGLPLLTTQLTASISADNGDAIVADGGVLVTAITVTLSAVDAIGPAVAALGPLPGITPGELVAFASALPRRLFGALIVSYLEDRQEGLVGLAAAVGVLDEFRQPGVEEDEAHPPFVLQELQLARLPDLLKAPAALWNTLFAWGSPGFDGKAMLARLAPALTRLGIPASIDAAGTAIESRVLELTPRPGGPPGLAGKLLYPILTGIDLTLPLTSTMSAHVQAQGNFTAGTTIDVAPPATVTFAPPTGTLSGVLAVDLVVKGRDHSHPITLFGETTGSRLQADEISIGAALPVRWDGTLGRAIAEPTLRFAITKGKAIVDTSNGNAFVAAVTGGMHEEATFGLSGTWTAKRGLQLDGSSGLEIALPVHAKAGPATLQSLYLRLDIRDGTLPLEISAAITTTFGPVDLTLDRVGVVATIGFPASGGNLGPLNLSFDLQAPTGIALSINGGGFKGGGMLAADPSRTEYAGALELVFQDLVTVKAFGLLSTRMPNGQDGFSLLVIISAEFVPIQLGLGFTMNGVGGLLGLNRTVLFDVLRDGVGDGSLNSILFPRDLAVNAPRIANDLRRIFPPLSERFLIGPMAKLGWGTPTLVSLDLGILIEIPRPAIAILGVLRMGVPAEDVPLLRLQANFLGVVDFEKAQASFDASLFDSRLMGFSLTGDLAVRLQWGDNANFLLTAGGFHPAFAPPPMGIGPLQRLGIELFAGNPRIRAEAYVALTSNTLQFGARVEVEYGIDLFNVYGFLSLDVLIYFDPFRFIAEISGMVAVRSGSSTLFSIRVDLTLAGPEPWNAKGRGSFRIGFIIKVTIAVHFDVTIGEERQTSLPTVDVLARLKSAVESDAAWRAIAAAGAHQQVTLREVPARPNVLLLHPFGGLQIAQKIVPLNLNLNRFGTAKPLAGGRFRIDSVSFGEGPVALEPTREQFAPAQFMELNDAERLSRRSFEAFDAGVRVRGGARLSADLFRVLQVAYEVIYVPKRQSPFTLFLHWLLFDAFALSNAAARSAFGASVRAASGLGTPTVRLGAEQFTVASTSDLTMHGSHLMFSTQAEAHSALTSIVRTDPGLRFELQVVPFSQVRRP